MAKNVFEEPELSVMTLSETEATLPDITSVQERWGAGSFELPHV